MVGCVEGILGMRPDLYGIKIAPSVPRAWKMLEIQKEFRGKKLHILVQNPNGKESGCEKLTVNGKVLDGNYVREELLTDVTEIVLVL